MNKNRCILYVFVFVVLLSTVSVSPLSGFEFPGKLKFNIYKDNQMIGNVALFYTGNTGIRRFNRELSSLRWAIYLEGETDFQYMHESYVFRDNLSLYRDLTITSGAGVTSQITLKGEYQNGSTLERRFHYRSKDRAYGSKKNITGNHRDIVIGKISSLLAAARHAAAGLYGSTETFHYLSPETPGIPITLVSRGENRQNAAGKNIPVNVISLTQNNREIHRFEFFRDINGYYYPVVIHFDTNNKQRGLEIRLDRFPDTSPANNPDQMAVVYLDFMDAAARTIRRRSPMDTLIHNAVFKEIKKELNGMILRSNKQLVMDLNTSAALNNYANIKQLIDITFDPDKPSKAKVGEIIRRLGIPGHVDIIVTGQYIDIPGSPTVNIRPIIVFKNNPRINTSNIMFIRNRMICPDRASGRKVPCPDAGSYIVRKIRQFLSSNVQFGSSSKGLTIEDAYWMIIERKFFCHSMDYGYHFEVLEKLRELERIHERNSIAVTDDGAGENINRSYTFKSGWAISAGIEPGKGIIKTVSINENNYADIFTLYWDPLEGNIANYDDALQLARQLNARKHEGHSDWRLPTLEEILSIARYNTGTGGFFPFGFGKDVTRIWTSTPLEQRDRKRLTFKGNDVYFVVNLVNDVRDPRNRKLQFDILDKNQTAKVLLVRSAVKTIKSYARSSRQGLSIAHLAFMKTSDRSPMVYDNLGRLINKAVNNGMRMASAANKLLEVKDEARQTFNTEKNANTATNIFFDPNMTNDEKTRIIIERMMNPNRVDLVVTGYFIDDGSSDMVSVRPIVIYKYNQDIQTENLQFKRSELFCRDPYTRQEVLCQSAAQQIAEAVKKLLGQA